MRIVMPRQFERIRLVPRRDQRECCITLQRPHDVAHLAVHARSNRRLGKPRTNARGNIGRRGARGHVAHGTIGQGNFEHIGHGPPMPRRCPKGQPNGTTLLPLS